MCSQSSKKDLHGVEGSRGWVSCIWFIGQSGACLSVVETFNFSSEAWTGFYFGAKEQFWVALGRLATLIPACSALHPSVHPSIPCTAPLLHRSYFSLIPGPQLPTLL